MSQIDIHCGKKHADLIRSNDDWDIDVYWKDKRNREFNVDLRIGVNNDDDLFIEVGSMIICKVTRNMDVTSCNIPTK